MQNAERFSSPAGPQGAEGREPGNPVRLVPFQGEVPEQLAGFFRRQNQWTWRDLRTVFCRHPETRRLVNILRSIDLVLTKAGHTLARGHWSIAGYKDARRKLESAIAKLGHLSNQVAADAGIRLPVVPERMRQSSGIRTQSPVRPPVKPGGPFKKLIGGAKKTFAPRTEAA